MNESIIIIKSTQFTITKFTKKSKKGVNNPNKITPNTELIIVV